MKNDAMYLQHILECIRRIEEHAASGREAFLSSHTFQDATLRNLQTLSESSQRLSAVTKDSQPQIAWAAIAGFRRYDGRDQSAVADRDRSFQSAPCFCQFIRMWRF